MIRSVIIDDEVKSCKVLKAMLDNYCPDVEVVATGHSASEGKEAILEHKPDLVFLDVQMPTGNGFAMLADMEPVDFKIIFVTAYDEYALQAIKFSALDYLLKPLSLSELKLAVQRYCKPAGFLPIQQQLTELKQNLNSDRYGLKRIALPAMDEIIFVEIDSIIRLEAQSNYTTFYLDGGKNIVVSYTLKNYEELLSGHNFLRVHNSHIINLKKVKKYIRGKTGSLVMSDGVAIEVSPRRKDEFFMRLNI